ncbi:MAG: type II secretion system major pseudopilin GspG [Neomegalonema sp.]|nr:type II secretion system major pseudopilin GspG [Neomegalonema sp.]
MRILRMLVRQTRRKRAGFSLMEMLVVLVILGLLAGLVGPRVIDYLNSAKTKTAAVQIELLRTEMDRFLIDNGRYPTESEGLAALVSPPPSLASWSGPYIEGDAVPLDPWGNPYRYVMPAEGGKAFEILSLGSDGAPGGQGDAADIRR